MKSSMILLLALLGLACSSEQRADTQQAANTVSLAGQHQPALKAQLPSAERYDTKPELSLTDVDKAGSTAEAGERKVIRNAAITIEVSSTTEAQHRVTSIAEAHGGFVVTSEAKQRDSNDPAQRTVDIKLVVRVPANKFGNAFDEIKQLARNTPEHQVTGQDVSEEYIDLEARIKTQKALEVQFLEIMRQANKITDALEVQRQIAEVRTVIEQLEGRKRFLENRSSLSTINVSIQAPRPMIAVSKTGFGHRLREAVSDSIGLAADMMLFFARFVIVMLPVAVFVLLPSGLVIRYLIRRAKRMRLAQALATPTPD